MRSSRLRMLLYPAVFGLAALLATGFARAEVYTWKDEKGVVHMSDRKVEDPGKNVTEMTGVQGVPASAGRKEKVQAMLANARNDGRYIELQILVTEYKRSHTYSMIDYFVCVDMSLDMANILKTRNFNTKVVAGNPKVDTAGLSPDKAMATYNHAWVVVELQPGVNVALETTGGFVVDDKVPNFEYYYQGLVFNTPRQAKDTDILIRSAQETCGKAKGLINDWNRSYAGRRLDRGGLEVKGMVEAKVAECNTAGRLYEDLIKTQYRKLY